MKKIFYTYFWIFITLFKLKLVSIMNFIPIFGRTKTMDKKYKKTHISCLKNKVN